MDDNENNAFYVLEDKNSATRTSEQLSKMEKANNSVNMTEINYGDLYYTISAKRKCCGSTVSSSLDLDKSPSKVERTGIFRRSVLGPVIHLKNPSKASEDNVPPSRIGDLKIRQLPGASTPDRLMAEWTAPGGNFDEGSVASYRFVFSSKIEDLLQPDPSQGQPEVLLGFDRIERAGTAAKFDFNFPHYDKDFYVGAYGFDIAGNRGKISNLVHVRVAAPKYVKSKEAEPIKSTPAAESMEIDWIVIGSICGVISVLIIMAILCIAYCIVVSRKKSSTKTGSTSSVIGVTGSDETDSSSFDSDIKNIMANPLGPALALPRNGQMGNNGSGSGSALGGSVSVQQSQTTPPSYATTPSTNVTPVYWSASQLLSKLDHHGNPHHGYYVPPGPQSLQLPQHLPPGRPHIPQNGGQQQQQPASLHNMSYEARPYPSWSYTNRSHNIPEEYTITVEDTSTIMPPQNGGPHMPPPVQNRGTPPQYGPPVSSANSKQLPHLSGKVPPPVMPKPRNVSQV